MYGGVLTHGGSDVETVSGLDGYPVFVEFYESFD